MGEFVIDTLNVRGEVLEDAKACVCKNREAQYGTPESNFAKIADLWSIYLHDNLASGEVLNEVDVAMMMALLKIARIKTGTQTYDSFVDLAGYAACGGECAFRKEKREERGNENAE